ncbi:MAG: Clp1/GlmU family protein, partial [Nitrososphaeria archaeon]
PESWLLIRGPARVDVKRGSVEVFGASIEAGGSFTIVGGRQVPMKGLTESEIIFILGESGSYELVEEQLIPDDWVNAVHEVLKISNPNVMIIGAVDTGKSGFTLYLANKLVANGFRVAVIDTDVGQSDIGPPGTISLTLLEKQIPSFLDTKLVDAYFVGDKSPVGHLLPIVVGSQKMVRKAQMLGANAIIINTSGLTEGGIAMALRYHMVEAIDPNVIIVLQREKESEHLVKPHEDLIKVIRLQSPKHILRRNREERGDFRLFKMAKYLSNAKSITLNLDNIILLNTIIKQMPENFFLKEIVRNILNIEPEYVGSDDTTAIIVIDKILSPNQQDRIEKTLRGANFVDVKIISTQLIKGLLLGLYDAKKHFLNIGILEKLDLHKNIITIKGQISESDFNRIKYVYFGYIVLNELGIEIRRLKPGTF